ncbi:MAG: DUF448 domain-containing protein [Desulfovibrionaceae bacterium]|nr:DUF448 domain-containing protein [Desulfovibrionaceae bacterium]
MSAPERMCVICRRRFPRRELRRHVLSPSGELCVDERQTMPGRGWYLCADPCCMQKFAKYKPRARHKGATTV